MRGIEKMKSWQMATAPILEVRVGLHVGRNKGRRADGGEILSVLLVVPEFFALDAHCFDADAHEANVIDVGLDVRARA